MANANTTQTAAQTARVSISGNPRTDLWHHDAIVKERGPRGEVGRGSPGKRIRRHARAFRIAPIRAWARAIAEHDIDSAIKRDCIAWLESKNVEVA